MNSWFCFCSHEPPLSYSSCYCSRSYTYTPSANCIFSYPFIPSARLRIATFPKLHVLSCKVISHLTAELTLRIRYEWISFVRFCYMVASLADRCLLCSNILNSSLSIFPHSYLYAVSCFVCRYCRALNVIGIYLCR